MIDTLQYNKNFETKNGFIKPNGEIIFIDGSFDEYADRYCKGVCFDTLVDAKYRNKAIATNTKNQINPYQSSKLTENENEAYMAWNIKYAASKNNLLTDFMVQVLHFNIINHNNRTIITSNPRSYCVFYHYIMNGWKIINLDRMEYDSTNNIFRKIKGTESVQILNTKVRRLINQTTENRP